MPPVRQSSLPPAKQSPLDQRDAHVNHALAVRFDALNQQFAAVEAKFRALKPVRPVFVYYDVVSVDGGPSYWDSLGFQKYNVSWHLVHYWGNDIQDDSELKGITLLADRPVAVRVRAAKEVRRLHEAIIADKEKFVPEVEEAIHELVDYCAKG
jgi:hypothetical protein